MRSDKTGKVYNFCRMAVPGKLGKTQFYFSWSSNDVPNYTLNSSSSFGKRHFFWKKKSGKRHERSSSILNPGIFAEFLIQVLGTGVPYLS